MDLVVAMTIIRILSLERHWMLSGCQTEEII
jgi:hypothetical protein